jgi:hypothetical protein
VTATDRGYWLLDENVDAPEATLGILVPRAAVAQRHQGECLATAQAFDLAGDVRCDALDVFHQPRYFAENPVIDALENVTRRGGGSADDRVGVVDVSGAVGDDRGDASADLEPTADGGEFLR